MLVLLGNKGNNLSIHEKKNYFLKLKNIHFIKCSIANVVKTVSIELLLISGSWFSVNMYLFWCAFSKRWISCWKLCYLSLKKHINLCILHSVCLLDIMNLSDCVSKTNGGQRIFETIVPAGSNVFWVEFESIITT